MQNPKSYTIATFRTGNPHNPILFFIHGWPDSHRLWNQLIEGLNDQYYCVSIDLPGFNGQPAPRWEVDIAPLVDRIAEEIAKILKDSGQEKVCLVGHDWGALLTYLIARDYPHLISKMVTLDVGAHLAPVSKGHALFLVSYQLWLAFVWMLGKVVPPLGNFLTRWFARTAKAPETENLSSDTNYLYFYFWRAKFFPKYSRNLPANYKLEHPILFLYGKDKIYPFHSKKWERMVNEMKGSKVVGIEHSDHWITVRQPSEVLAQIREWLKQDVQK